MDLGEKISKDEFCSDGVKTTLDKWAAEPVEDMEAGRVALLSVLSDQSMMSAMKNYTTDMSRIGCVIPRCNFQCGITQPILRLS